MSSIHTCWRTATKRTFMLWEAKCAAVHYFCRMKRNVSVRRAPFTKGKANREGVSDAGSRQLTVRGLHFHCEQDAVQPAPIHHLSPYIGTYGT
eukprot:6201405-Pleurochrysis_carterae.AAC.1